MIQLRLPPEVFCAYKPQKSFSDCVNDWGLGGLGFTEEAANLIQDINDLEGTSRELLAVTWKNENSFRMRPGPNTKSGAANWMLWDVGPFFHINIHWTMKALEKGEVSDRGLIGKNIFGYSFYRSDGKTPVSEFDGSPLENGQMAARRLNAGGGSDEDKAAGYAPEYGRAHRRRDFRKYANFNSWSARSGTRSGSGLRFFDLPVRRASFVS